MKKNRMTPSFPILRKVPARLRYFPVSLALIAVTSLGMAPARSQDLDLNESKLTFVGADIESVIKAVGHYTGTTFIVDPRVKGTINLVSEKPVTKRQAFALLTSTLRLQGYAVVTADGFTKVVPESDGKLQAGPTMAPGVRGDQIATQIYRLNYENSANLVTVLRPLISPNNSISANPGNNSVVVTDYADNLKRLEKIIATLDVPASSDVDVISLKYAIASDIVALVQRLTEQSSSPSESTRMTVLADSRTNTILLHAPSLARANLVKTLIAKLDQPTALPGNVHVVYLRNADAMKLAQTLRSIVAADSGTGSSSSASASGSSSLSGSGSGAKSSATSTGSGGASSSLSGSGSVNTSSGGSGGGSTGTARAEALSSGGPGGFIQADSATNTLIITASEAVYRNMRAVIDQLDARRAQVYIEAMIVEVSESKSAEFGVQWMALTGNSSSNYRMAGGTSFNLNAANNIVTLAEGGSAPGAGLSLGLFRQISGQLGLGALASALEQTGNANVLSVPTLTTLDNEEAKIMVGQNVPFVTGQYTNTTSTTGSAVNPFQTIERKDVGIILRVRPQISEGGTVKLAIYQEVSNIDTSATTTTTTSSTSGPITKVRTVETNVLVDDGAVVVLGGLMSEDSGGNVQKVPLLGDLPYIGNLFQYNNKSRNKSNLMIFLRPTVIRDADKSNVMSTDRYDYMRTKVIGDKGEQLRLNLPALAPEKNGMLLPQDIMSAVQSVSKLDAQDAAKHAPVAPDTSSVTPVSGTAPAGVPDMSPTGK